MTDFDRLAASAPVNRLAAVQTSGGEAWEPARYLSDYFADPPPMKPVLRHHQMSPTFQDFTGVRIGRLAVLGMRKNVANERGTWVCRCRCGGYCTRKAKALRKGLAGDSAFVAMCGRCKYQIELRENPYFRHVRGAV